MVPVDETCCTTVFGNYSMVSDGARRMRRCGHVWLRETKRPKGGGKEGEVGVPVIHCVEIAPPTDLRRSAGSD